MPLHLLGKKSWNVYNQTNIEKVKRDEAAAAAREEAEEQRMQEVDNERRMRILRGLPVDDLPEAGEDFTPNDRSTEAHGPSRERKRRRIAGEDDTDRDMRYAMEDRATVHDRASKDTLKLKSKSADAPIIDRTGNIDLFPAEARAASRKEKAKNPEKEAEDARKKREFEDQYTMRFSNAAGFKQSVDQKPWYYTSAGNETEAVTAKDAFGNEDPRRKERQKLKTASDDPMVAIQRGVQGVRKVEKERKQWKDERLAEVDDLIRLEKKEAKRHKRHHRRRSEDDELEDFSLDSAEPSRQRTTYEHRHHSREGGDARHRHRHRHSSRHKDRSRSPRRGEGYPRHHTEQRAISA